MTVYTSIWINDVYYWNIWDSQVYGINTIARLTSVVFDSSYLPFHLDIFHLFCILSLELGFSHPALDFRVYVTSFNLVHLCLPIFFLKNLPLFCLKICFSLLGYLFWMSLCWISLNLMLAHDLVELGHTNAYFGMDDW